MLSVPTRRLGDSDLEVSVVGLGCNNFGRRVGLDGTRAVVDAALEQGVTFFDTAEIYGDGESERLLGEVLSGRRDQVVLATKFGMRQRGSGGAPDAPQGSRTYIRWAIEGSLRRLQTDTIDLYQYHEPDGVTPIEETLAALDELVREGKTRFIGCSNVSAVQLEQAERVARERGYARFVSLQNQYSLLERGLEADVTEVCQRFDVGILPFFPLASGLLTGKYRRGAAAPEGTRLHGRDTIASDEQFDVVEALERFAQERGLTLLGVAIAGLAAQQMVASVIAGATKPEQVRENAAALSWQPSAEDLRALDAAAPTPRG
jgi:aryl-alcohol dehydrogenase-like predicted oxidoreductase